MKKTETVYAPFSFRLSDIMQQRPIHEGQDGCVLVFQDQYAAYEQWNKLKQLSGQQLSAYGVGPNGTQCVYAPTCTGMMHMEVPVGTLKDAIDGKRVCVMNDNFPVGPQDVKIQSNWVKELHIYISGDVAHGPIIHTQVLDGALPDYDQLSKLAILRFQDLERISAKLASDTSEARTRANFDDEFTRDSLRAMYCGNGFLQKRIYFSEKMSEDDKALAVGLEYLQPYMRNMDSTLGIDAILRHAYSMEQEFRDIFPEYYKNAIDSRVAAAATVANIMEKHASNTVTADEKTVFLSLRANALRNMDEYTEHVTQSEDTELEPSRQIDDVGDVLR